MINLINLIYPNVCGICDKISNNNICKKCELMINNISEYKIEYYKNKNFTKHLYLFKYQGIIREKIIDYKFNDKPYLYKMFVEIILKNKKINNFFKNYDIIIPVPIHKKRNKHRGYNQSELIAKSIAKKTENLEFINDCLIKKQNNKIQSSLKSFERKQNVIGAYELKNVEKLNKKKILLFDDIYTTGSTANECCNILKKAGIESIDVFTLAKD